MLIQILSQVKFFFNSQKTSIYRPIPSEPADEADLLQDTE